MPPLQLRQEFPTLKAFKEALHAWAIEAHFEPRILKSDTGRVRVGCKRDPNCPFVVRCNWERKNGREPLARVTVLRERHTCLNGLEWRAMEAHEGMAGQVMPAVVMGSRGMSGQGQGMNGMNGSGGAAGAGAGGGAGGGMLGGHGHGRGLQGGVSAGLEIRQDEDGNIVGGARVLGPVNPRGGGGGMGPNDDMGGGVGNGTSIVPVLPKVQRNSASRLPFLMEILPRLMAITKETTPVEIRECLLREYGAEVHLQQCRRAKTEILKKRNPDGGAADGNVNVNIHTDGMDTNNNGQVVQVQIPGQQQQQDLRSSQTAQSMDGISSETNDAAHHQQLFGDMNAAPTQSPHQFQLHAATGVGTPQVPHRNVATSLNAVGEAPVRCPYCVNHRWMKSIKDAVEHMSMHVVV